MENKVQCLDCPTSENEYDDVDTSEDNVQLSVLKRDNNSIVIDKKWNNNVRFYYQHKSSGRLKINKDGIIIKSN
jgi:hypothetical protein